MIGDLGLFLTLGVPKFCALIPCSFLNFMMIIPKPYSSHYFIVVLPQLENNQNLQQNKKNMCSLTTQQHNNDSMMQINDILQQKIVGPLFCHTSGKE